MSNPVMSLRQLSLGLCRHRCWQRAHTRVLGVHDLQTRSAGRVDCVELHLELDDHMPLMVAHEESDNVEDAIISALPQADVMIHLDPVSLAEEQLDEKIEAVENPSRN